MREKWNEFAEKLRAGAAVAGEYAAKTAETAGKKATEMYGTSKINLKIFDLNADIGVLYKEIGRMVYAARRNEDVPAEELEAKFAVLDEKMARLEALKGELSDLRKRKQCANCRTVYKEGDFYCPKCGEKIEREEYTVEVSEESGSEES